MKRDSRKTANVASASQAASARQAGPIPPEGGGDALRKAWPIGLILLATCLAYIPAMKAGYIWDDGLYVTENPLIKADDGWWKVWDTHPSVESAQATYYPLTSDVFWLEWHIWGNSPWLFHLVNILLHAISAILLWRVLARLKVPGAVAAGVIFAVHPVTVETVAWITELKNTLPMLFSLLFFLAWLRFDDSCNVPGGRPNMGETPMPRQNMGKMPMPRPNWKWYGLSLLAFLAALLSKTSIVALPLTLPLLAWWRHGRITRRDLLLVLPYLPLSLWLGLVTIRFEHLYDAFDIVVRPENWGSRIAASGWIVWFYLSKIVLPIHLNMIYPRWAVDGSNWLSYVPLALLAGVFGLFFLCRRTWGKGPLLALGFFVIALLPVLGFADIGYFRFSLVADHFQYTPMVAIIALLAGVAAWAMGRKASLAALRVPLAAIAVLVLGVLSYQHAGMFHDLRTLWSAVAAKNEKAFVAWGNLGSLALDDGTPEKAIACFDRSISIQPDYYLAYFNRGNARKMLHQLPEAVADYDAALRIQPKHAQSYLQRGLCLAELHQLEPAVESYTKAIEVEPRTVMAYLNRAACLAALRQYDQAWGDLQTCRRYGLNPPPQLVQKVAGALGRPPF